LFLTINIQILTHFHTIILEISEPHFNIVIKLTSFSQFNEDDKIEHNIEGKTTDSTFPIREFIIPLQFGYTVTLGAKIGV